MNQRKIPWTLISITFCFGISTIALLFLSFHFAKTAKDPDGLEFIFAWLVNVGLFLSTIISAAVTGIRWLVSERSENDFYFKD